MKKIVYKISLNNWEKYNGGKKKGHRCILISVGFLNDSKIRMLTPVNRLLYLSCLLVAGESTSSQFEVSHESLVFQSGVKSGSLQSQLDHLQSLQLLSYEKTESLYNRIEREKKRIEKNTSVSDAGKEKTSKVLDEIKDLIKNKPKKKPLSQTQVEQNRIIKNTYVDAYRLRYGVEAVTKNATFNTNVSQLREKLGAEEAIKVVKFYVNHNESFYLKNTHKFSLCLRDCETLRTQMLRGVQITTSKIRNFEKQQTFQDTLEEIRNRKEDKNAMDV